MVHGGRGVFTNPPEPRMVAPGLKEHLMRHAFGKWTSLLLVASIVLAARAEAAGDNLCRLYNAWAFSEAGAVGCTSAFSGRTPRPELPSGRVHA